MKSFSKLTVRAILFLSAMGVSLQASAQESELTHKPVFTVVAEAPVAYYQIYSLEKAEAVLDDLRSDMVENIRASKDNARFVVVQNTDFDAGN